jgi:hypothetical protein
MSRIGDGGHTDLPFSRPLSVEDLDEYGKTIVVQADSIECDKLAKDIGIEAVRQVRALLAVRREGKSGLHVSGEMRAIVRQICVVSLDRFDAEIIEPIDLHFVPEAEQDEPTRAGERIDRMDDPPDPIIDGKVDLGQLVAEFLVLGLDPYPRKPGAEFSYGDKPERDRDESAFAVLQKLKKSDG